MRKIILLILIFTISLIANEKVTLQLKWFHQFQFAGYYAAKEKGFYADVGLDVEIKQRDLKYNNIQQVIEGNAQYGVADSVLFLYKTKNEPVVLVSPIFQHSPSVLLTLKSSNLNSLYDFDNKDMIFYENDTDGFSILAILRKFDLKPNLIRKRENKDYLKLMRKEVAIAPGYLSNEPFYFKEKNIDINIINPLNYGVDLYGDMLFTNEDEAKNHPLRVKKFKEATIKGWAYALEHKEEIIKLIQEKYNSGKSYAHLKYEANVIDRMISKESIPLGTIDRGRIQYINSLYKEYGLAKNVFDVKDFIFEDYNYSYLNLNLTLEEKNFLKTHPVLKVQNLSSYPPFNFVENGIAKGYSVDYFRLIGKNMGVNIEFVNDTWANHLKNLQTSKIDIIPHIAINEERKKFVNYTSIKHIKYIPAMALRNGSNIKTIEDLFGKKVSVLDKSFIYTILKKYYKQIEVTPVSTYNESLANVSKGISDAALGDLAIMEYYIKNNWLTNLQTLKVADDKYIKKSTLYVGVEKNNKVLKSLLEKVENSIPSYEIIKLRNKWFDSKNENIDRILFNKKEIDYLKNKRVLNLCIHPNWMPIEAIKKDVNVGISSEYVNMFKTYLPIPINLLKTKDWNQTLSLLEKGKCDFSPSMFTHVKNKNLLFTKQYYDFPLVVATKVDKPFIENLNTLNDKKIGVLKNSFYKTVLEEKYPKIDFVDILSANEGLRKVNNDKLYGVVDFLPVLGYEIQQNYLGNLKVTGQVQGEWGFSIGTKSKEPILNDIFNKLIATTSSDDKSQIMQKWISVKYQKSIDYTKLLWVMFFFIVVISIIIYKNKTIKKVNKEIQKNLDLINENVITSQTDKKGNIVDVSQAFCNISGYSKRELVGKPHSIVRHEDMSPDVFKDMWETIKSGHIWVGEIKNKNKNGQSYWVHTTITPDINKYGEITGYRSIRSDITDKKRIETLSITDELTTLYNKRHFNIIFEQEINRIKRTNEWFGFLIFDVDNFKQYNDNYGHQNGDEVLIAIGKKVNSLCKRSSDIPFRIGGEEFAILFQSNSLNSASHFAELVRQEIESLKIEHKYNNASTFITISCGLYTANGKDIKSSYDIYKIADDALYEAKKGGRNRVEVAKS